MFLPKKFLLFLFLMSTVKNVLCSSRSSSLTTYKGVDLVSHEIDRETKAKKRLQYEKNRQRRNIEREFGARKWELTQEEYLESNMCLQARKYLSDKYGERFIVNKKVVEALQVAAAHAAAANRFRALESKARIVRIHHINGKIQEVVVKK